MAEDATRGGGDAQAQTDHAATSPDRLGTALDSEHVPFAAGTFVALGAGFVLTLFLASSFSTGTGIPGGGGVPGVGSAQAFALLLAPLLGLLTGVRAGRDPSLRGGTAALAAGVGAGVGVFGLALTVLVLGTSLSTGGPASVGIGPLVGLGLGTAVTAAGAAALTAWIERTGPGVETGLPWRPAGLAAAVFAVFGVGLVLSLFAVGELANGNAAASSALLGGLSSGAVTAGPSLAVVLAPVLGAATGLLAGESGDASTATATAIGAGVGFVVGFLLLFGIAHVLDAEAMDGTTVPFGPVVGVAAGTAVVTGLTAVVPGWSAGSSGSEEDAPEAVV